MDWEPNERDAWVIDAQRWISKINGVLQCKIDLDATGEVTGVHVVAGMDREPRHIVRDVESLLKARLGLDVYYKKIGVVQVLDNGPVASETPFKRAKEPVFADVSNPEIVLPHSLKGSVEDVSDPAEPPVENPSFENAQSAVLLTEEIAPRLDARGRDFPLCFGGQPLAFPARKGIGLVVTHVAHRLVRPQFT